jgi:hypothetical protein
MQRRISKPIFVVGSPRSGTSILAWCLGQHANILPVPESNWMGDFAVDLAISYQIGAARDSRSVLSAMDISPDEFFATFGQSINDLILAHRKAVEAKRELETYPFVRRSTTGPKARWVDGTPEYSLHICGLRKLFPDALFVHLVRDVDSVVRSLLNFHRVSGSRLVANEEEAYKYWLRRVKACLKAEQAYGPRVIHRLRYSSLVENPEWAVRSLLDFVSEPYSAKCLEPLAERINSSNVPPDFKSDDPATDPAIVEEARQLSAEIEKTAQSSESSSAAAEEMEAAFRQSCLKAMTLEQELKDKIASQQQHYAAEIEGYKSQIARQEQHYTAQIEDYKSQIASQQQHYAGEIEDYKSQIASQQQHNLAEINAYKSQIAKQEQHYTGEIEDYKSQIASQQQHYAGEIEDYKTQIAKQQQHYLAEIGEYKSQILKEQQHYLAEIEAYKSQIARQEHHYTAEIEEYKSEIGRQKQYYSNRLYKQLQDTKKLASLLDELAKAGAGLRSSRFWRFANRAASIEAKLFHHDESVPDRKFEQILARYSRWRASHPEIAKDDLRIDATGSSVPPSNSDAQFENVSETEPIHKLPGSSAEA